VAPVEADAAEEQGVPASSSNLGVEEGGPQRWRISSCTLGAADPSGQKEVAVLVAADPPPDRRGRVAEAPVRPRRPAQRCRSLQEEAMRPPTPEAARPRGGRRQR